MALLEGPAAAYLRMQFRPAGRYLAAGFHFVDLRKEARVWEWRSGRVLSRQEADSNDARSFDFHPGENSLALPSPTEANAMDHLALPTGALLGRFSLNYSSAQVRFSPDGRFLGVQFNRTGRPQTWDAPVRVFDAQKHQLAYTLEGRANVRSLCWHPNSQWLFVGRNDSRFQGYDLLQGRDLGAWGRHEMPVVSGSFDSSGDSLATRTHDGTVSVWDVVQERVRFSTQVRGGELSFAPGDAELALGVSPPMLYVWGIEPGTLCRPIPNTAQYYKCLEFSPDGSLLVGAGPFQGLTFCDVVACRVVATQDVLGISAAFFDPSGGQLVTSGHPGLQVWPVRWTNPPVASGDLSRIAAAARLIRMGPVERLSVPTAMPLENGTLGYDGQTVAVEAGFRGVMTGNLRAAPASWRTIAGDGAEDFSFSRSGRWIAIVPRLCDGLRVLDVSTGKAVLEHGAPLGSVLSVRFSPDDRWLAAATQREYLLWETDSWRSARRIPNEGAHEPHAPADFSPDGRILAIVWQGRFIRLLETDNGSELATLTAPEPALIHILRFSPDGTRLAFATRNRGIRVWDLRALRRELGRRGLDWDHESFPTAPSEEPTPPLKVEFLSDPVGW
jgi:WD40 repeat protein